MKQLIMANFLSTFPDSKTLLEQYPDIEILNVNAHLHTPYSFSAFNNVQEIFTLAKNEDIAVAGINDFFVADGYESFQKEAGNAGVFPLFNIEFIGLLKEEQQNDIRINDPNNPGRCYFCGKGLNYPFTVNDQNAKKLQKTISESQVQVRSMIDKANKWFSEVNVPFKLDYDDIKKKLAKELVRERHLAKAIRLQVFDHCKDEAEISQILSRLLGGKGPKSGINDLPGLENEIRSVLLKAGGKAFVEEDEKAFLSIEEIISVIHDAGGIPCYPVLLDDKNGNYTEYEADPEKLYNELLNKKTGCIELIPGRNDAGHLEEFVDFFNSRGFIVLMGTEHNTPDMIPLTCVTRGNKALSERMKTIAYEGACVIAAHQYMKSKDLPGFVQNDGLPFITGKDRFVAIGNAVIHYYIDHNKNIN